MRKLILFVFVIVSNVAIHAQAPAEFGIFAGPQATTASYFIKHIKQTTEHKYGFQLGATAKMQVENNFYFTPSVYYSMKGYGVTYSARAFPPDTDAVNNDTRIHTFEIAPMVQYQFGKNAGHFFLKAGPSIDLQLSGKEKFELENGNIVNRQMKFSYGDYGRFTASLVLHAGYETANGLMIFAQYTHGAGSLNNADGGPSIKHRAYGISIGKIFRNKKIVVDTRNRE